MKMHELYKMLDYPKDQNTPATIVSIDESYIWNNKNYGIFWTVNSFGGLPRLKTNLKKINAWALDLDDGTKEEQWEKIKSGIRPSRVIETKRGFQIYFNAIDATLEHFKHIMLDRLVPYYGADKRAWDLCRILRAPNYYHCKDPENKFLIKECRVRDINDPVPSFTENDICNFYQDVNKEKREAYKNKIEVAKKENNLSDNVFNEIYNLDQMEALIRLSGTDAVCGEVFTFKPTSKNRYNIFVNGKSTSCFIDEKRMIGSLDGGSPTIWQFVNWYFKDHKKTYQHIRKHFPELKWTK